MTGEEEGPESSSPRCRGYCSPIDLTTDHKRPLKDRYLEALNQVSDFEIIRVPHFEVIQGKFHSYGDLK
ncbi:MAG: hypothetical protein GKC02_08725 [Methanomassiliicoccales archaeon]|nr:hypothetical protein [Methanomassiliicoccales archaeon]